MKETVDRILIVTIVGASLLIATLDLVGVLDSVTWLAERIPALTLVVVGIIAGYIASERFDQLKRIEQSVEASTETLIASLSGVETTLLPAAEEGFQYMADCVLQAEHEITHAALAPPISRRLPYAQEWEQAIEKVLKENRVIYRYVASFQDDARSKRVKRHLADPNIQKYYVRYYDVMGTPPLLSFVLVDNEEIIMHYPYERGQIEMFLSIKHPNVVHLFAAYFENLWNGANEYRGDSGKVERGNE